MVEARLEAARRDFDFLHGKWAVSHRRLATRLVGSSDWQEFTGEAETRPLLGGMSNIEEHRASHEHAGIALRTLDLSTQRWAIYWVSVRDGLLQPPVFGTFRDGQGIFEGEDVDGGVPVRVRYRWDRIDTGRPRWEQAFSTDGGLTWETNWTMDFERISE